jgi:hypothetical protein
LLVGALPVKLGFNLSRGQTLSLSLSRIQSRFKPEKGHSSS